jgi:hypothetical protein
MELGISIQVVEFVLVYSHWLILKQTFLNDIRVFPLKNQNLQG